MNRSEFWSQLSVTQSGGSRYESGKTLQNSVRRLLHVTYDTDKQAGDLLAWLRSKGSRRPARGARTHRRESEARCRACTRSASSLTAFAHLACCIVARRSRRRGIDLARCGPELQFDPVLRK
ncbi:hypothetical protein [Aromatoleum evansii]|uniref:hypothetical protein n=1 Tax=Aromatoleum evansii TaxID=59406 RepID=UPI003BB5F94C